MLTRSRARKLTTHPTTSGSSLSSASQPPGPAPTVSPEIPVAAVASSSSDEYFSPPTTAPPARRRGRGRPPASLGPRGPPASDRVPAAGGSVQRMRWTSSINENVMRSYFGATEGGINLTAYRGRMLSLFQVLEPTVNVSVQRLSDQVRVIQRNRMLDDAVLDRLRLESQSSRVSPATPPAAVQRQPTASPRPDHVGDADDDAAISTLKSTCEFIKTQLCTIAISLTLFNSVRLPKEAFRYGAVPYLVVYSFWLLAAGLPTTLLQLAMGQLSQQDPVGVWRAVPILRGVGHLKVLSSYVCCVYYMMYVALSSAYLVWIGKGTFPLKDCTKLHITPNGYENKMNATECFNSTFLAPFTEYPQYLGIMAILIFLLWFFVPILLYRLHKTLKTTLAFLTIIVVAIAILLTSFLAKTAVLDSMFESCVQWTSLQQPYIWHSTLVQALLSTQIVSGYLTSAGGSVYRHSDVRWTSALVIMTSIFAGWLWVLLWESIGGNNKKDTSFISILVLIYQSSVSERRNKEWPLLAFGVVFFSGVISVLILLYPVYDKLHRMTGDHWRVFACAASAVGTALTVAVLARGLEVATMLDELVVPVLAVFTTAVEVVGFVFIYGWCYLTVDIEFLTGVRLPYFWVATWWLTPVLFIGVSGWWLRSLLRVSWGNGLTLWPLLAVFVVILVVMVMLAAVAVAKEEQFNLVTKLASAFRPSRLWGPEEPMARYVWMSQRYVNETLSTDNESTSEPNNYSTIMFNKEMDKKYQEELYRNDMYQRTYNNYNKNEVISNDKHLYGGIRSIYGTHTIPRGKKKSTDEKYRSPNICIAKDKLGGPIECSCNRHFTLNVPDLRSNEVTTSL